VIVGQPHLRLDAREARIVARIESESAAFAPLEVYFGVPRCHAGWLDGSGNAFVPALFPLAARLGESLRLKMPISPALLKGAAEVSRQLSAQWKKPGTVIEADSLPADISSVGGGVGLLFNRGLNGCYAAWYATFARGSSSISHFLYLPELEGHYQLSARMRAEKLTRAAAAPFAIPVISISTNLRHLLELFIPWEQASGSVLAGAALALGEWLAHLIFPSSTQVDAQGNAIGPMRLEALWSTERTTIQCDGVDKSRQQKWKELASRPEIVAGINACSVRNLGTNCGRCQKCLEAQKALASVGFAGLAALFPTRTSKNALADTKDEPVRQLSEESSLDLVIEAAMGLETGLLPESIRRQLPGPIVQRESVPARSTTQYVEITWAVPIPGRIALPLRPSLSELEQVLLACRQNPGRTNRWCMIDVPEPGPADLLRRLTEIWGPGIAFCGRARIQGGDHATPRDEAVLVQQACRVRVWLGCRHWLDPFRVLESLRNGCLPLQFVPEEGFAELAACVSNGLSAFLAPLAENECPPPLDEQEIAGRLDQGLSVILAGSFERDWKMALDRCRSSRQGPSGSAIGAAAMQSA
jgi:hypothetical protein